jgi:hypothetical protein
MRAQVRLETATDGVRARAAGSSDLPALDEVRIWLATERLYHQLKALCLEESDRREAYAAIYGSLTDHAVGYFQRRKQGWLFRAQLSWLRAEAGALRRKDAIRKLDEQLAACAGWA